MFDILFKLRRIHPCLALLLNQINPEFICTVVGSRGAKKFFVSNGALEPVQRKRNRSYGLVRAGNILF